LAAAQSPEVAIGLHEHIEQSTKISEEKEN
jgi:hypothetical protein